MSPAPWQPRTALPENLNPATCVPPPSQAITRMLRALDETVIAGVPTTGPFHKLLLNHHAFKAGNVDTGFIPKYIDELKTPPPTSKVREDEATAAAAAAVRARRGLKGQAGRRRCQASVPGIWERGEQSVAPRHQASQRRLRVDAGVMKLRQRRQEAAQDELVVLCCGVLCLCCVQVKSFLSEVAKAKKVPRARVMA